MNPDIADDLSNLPITLERDSFTRDLIRELAGILEDVIGLEQASGLISVVGQNIGNQINHTYRAALNVSELNRKQIKAVLIDLKKRIQGDFYLISEDNEKLILGNRACPFAEKVKDRESLCMMTSNVFGVIAAENVGYGKVTLDKTIARGDPECRIVVSFSMLDEQDGKEYFKNS